MPSPLPTRRITLRDVAARAGCHFTTVSLALRSRPGIPETTRVRIRQLADELGYRPDPLLASLASYRHESRTPQFRATLAWITNFPTRTGWRQTELYHDYYRGARERAHELGFELQDFWLRDGRMTPDRATQILTARGIDGLILAPQPGPADAVALEWRRFSTVVIGPSVASPALHMVSPNQYRSMKLVIDQLKARGYRRIGLVMLEASDVRVEHNWLAGYLVMQRVFVPRDRLPALLLPAWDEQRFAVWLRRNRPDVIVTKCSEVAVALPRLGSRVPEDVGTAFLSAAKSSGELAGLDERPLEVGAAAVDFLLTLLRHSERGIPDHPRRLLIEGEWVEGASVRPPSSPS